MSRSKFQVMIQLVVLVKPLIGYMIMAIIMGVIGHICATSITVFSGFAILHILHPSASLSLGILFSCLCIFALARGFLRYGEQACNHYIAFTLLALIRDQVFTSLRRLCPAKLEGKDKGNLISIITSDIELLEVFYAHTISPICIAIIFCLVMIFWIGQYHILLGLFAFVAYAVIGIILPWFTSKQSGNSGALFREKAGVLSSFVLDNLRGLSEIIQFDQGIKRMDRMNQITDSLLEYDQKMKYISGKNIALTNMMILIFDGVMMIISAMLLDFDGSLVVTLILTSSFGPVVALSSLATTLQNTFAAGNRVLDILEESPVVQEITGNDRIDFDGVSVDNVSFSYEDEIILNDVSLSIPKNKIIGIIGKSGSGKSTLLKLLMRFWQVEHGFINISERNINDINTSNLREMESFMTQETHLFHDSIKNNLRIAKLDASDEEMINACKKASIHDFIMSLPKGYDTQVGELGDTLSGGERQRLGLARSFLHDAPFLLLDEPTSNLDSLNEAVILKSLDQECKHKTVMVVSHRKSTMSIVDTLYSVEHGRMS